METGIGYNDLANWLDSGTDATSFVIHPPDFKNEIEIPPQTAVGSVGVYSSGSTGKPQLLWWNISELQAGCSLSPHTAGWTWATCYQPWSFAGIHLACQAHSSKGRVLPLGRDWRMNHSLLNTHQPQAISATPTFLDLLIQSRSASTEMDWSPKQITIGGEILRPATGARIQSAFPNSRLTLIYASADFGCIAKTHRVDGWFSFSSLQPRFKNLKIVKGELQLETHEKWIQTRDLCEIQDDHFRVLGRLDRVLNTGGEKICLDEIETLAESFPEVRRASAFAKSNAIVGQVVALHLEPAISNVHDQSLDEVMQKMRKQLPKPAWPRWYAWGDIREMKNGKRTHQTPIET